MGHNGRAEPRMMTVYMVRALAGERRGQVKIGITSRPNMRFVELSRDYCVRGPIEVIWTRRGTRDTERSLHARFADQSCGREWFALTLEQRVHFRMLRSTCERRIVLPDYRDGRLRAVGRASPAQSTPGAMEID